MNKIIYILLALILASCREGVSESQIAAQVGKSVLTYNEIRMKVPLSLSGADSAAFVREYIDDWVDEQMLYEQGLRNLPNIEEINQQIDDYRHQLVSQSYEKEILEKYMSEEISEAECLEFYEKHQKQITLKTPVIKGVFIKVLNNSSKVKDIKKWLDQLNEGKTDCIEEFDQYGIHLAAEYDNFFDTWVSMYRLTDKLPVTVVDPAQFLKLKTYELKDENYYYLFVIKNFRLAGDIAPFEYSKTEVYEMLVHQKRREIRTKLLQDLKTDGLETGFVKINK